MVKNPRIDEDVLAYIAEHGKFGETHSDVLRRLLPNFPVSHGSEKKKKKNFEPLYGHSVVSVIRWMGGHGWTEEAARMVLTALGREVKSSTVKTQIYYGKKGIKDQAKLTPDQIKELGSLRSNAG